MTRKIYSSEEVAKRMEALPEAAADFLYSSEMGAMVKTISDKYSLHIDQMGLLEAETGQLILGLTEVGEFVPYITESLKISTAQATAIAKDINEQVMSKIRTSMGQPSGVITPASVPPTPSMPSPTPSIAMPSSVKPIVPPITTPAPAPLTTPVPTSAPAPMPKPIQTPNLLAADAILSEKKVTPPATTPTPATPPVAAAPTTPATSTVPKIDPAQPQNYKADPYREPTE